MTEKEVADFVTEQAQTCGLTPRQWAVRLKRISPLDIARGMWKIEREAHAATKAEMAVVKKSLATAERDRDRWKAVHDREWDVEVYPSGDCSVFDPKDKSGKWEIVDSGPTLEAALDAAFARFPLEKK